MRIVVTGATGNIGTSVVAALRADPAVEDVVGFARRRPAATDDGEFVAADLAVDPLDPIVEGADAVVHLAWKIRPAHDPMAQWRTNVLGSARLARAAERNGVPALIFASSLGVYAPATSGAPVDETFPRAATSPLPYTRHKVAVERLLDALEARAGTRMVRLRPGRCSSPGRPPASGASSSARCSRARCSRDASPRCSVGFPSARRWSPPTAWRPPSVTASTVACTARSTWPPIRRSVEAGAGPAYSVMACGWPWPAPGGPG